MVTCWERADLLALVGDVYCIFVTFTCGILGRVWYLIVSFPDLCRLSYFHQNIYRNQLFSRVRVLYHQYPITNHSESIFKSKIMSILMIIFVVAFSI